MAQPTVAKNKKRKDVHERYTEFIEKFEAKLTTDDCITPPAVYDVVSRYVREEWNVSLDRMVRPFWPGEDYEAFTYPEGCVVVDNPPFSIIAKITRYYCANGVFFFLFGPQLTLFTAREQDLTYIAANANIRYENGAIINTGFITNLPSEYRIMTAPDLARDVEAACEMVKPQRSKYIHSPFVVTPALLGKIKNIPFRVRKKECFPVDTLKAMRAMGTRLFGGGYLISERAAAERAAAERAAAERAAAVETITLELSEQEKKIVDGLSREN